MHNRADDDSAFDSARSRMTKLGVSIYLERLRFDSYLRRPSLIAGEILQPEHDQIL